MQLSLKSKFSQLIKEVFSNYFDDEMDQEYTIRLFQVLFEAANEKEVYVNQVALPIPTANIDPADYPNWFEEKIPSRQIDAEVLQLHEKHLKYYSTLRAEEFIENLENLWENSTNNVAKLNDELDQDCLYYAIKLCNDKLPQMLPKIDEHLVDIRVESSVSFAILQVLFLKIEKKNFFKSISFVKSDLILKGVQFV